MNATHAEYRVEIATKFGPKVQRVEIEKGPNALCRAIDMAAAALGVTGRGKWVDVTCDGRFVWAGEVSL